MKPAHTKSAVIAVTFGILAANAAHGASSITWEPSRYDPAVTVNRSAQPADLIVPMPCGGAMAFMRVDTEARADNPLDDQRFRMGAPDISRAPIQYTRKAYIRGAFDDLEKNSTYFYMGRYEVSRDQYLALDSWAKEAPCPEAPLPDGNLPQTGITWYEAQRIADLYSVFARGNFAEGMPAKDGVQGFIRLPTETEWEFAARGGTAVSDPAEFNGRKFKMDGRMEEYTWHEGRRSAGNEIKPIGFLKPNPLGLHDIYGNAEEMVLGLFALNRGGRNHGQPGGFVTRGGSYRNKSSEITSATREEYPFYFIDRPESYSSGSVGMRLVLSGSVLTSDKVIWAIEDAWEQNLNPDDESDPKAILSRMIEQETVVETVEKLENVQSALVSALQESEEATELALRRAVFAGATSLRAANQLSERIDRTSDLHKGSLDTIKAMEDALDADRKLNKPEAVLSTRRRTIETIQRNLVDTEHRLKTYRSELDIHEINYVSSVVAVFESSTEESVKKAKELLLAEMQKTDQVQMIESIERFTQTVAAYRAKPDMNKAEILALPRQ